MEAGRQHAAHGNGAKLAEVPNVGHIPHLEAKELFHRELLSFLNQ